MVITLSNACMSKRERVERREHVEMQRRAPSRSAEEVTTLARGTFNVAARAAQIYRSRTAVRRREILEAVASNPTVGDRMMRLSLRRPFSLLPEAAASSNWCTTADDLRTFF